MRLPASQHLTELTTLLDDVCLETAALTQDLSEAQRLWRPGPERWGVADCFEHLIATGTTYHSRVRAAIEQGPAAGPGAVYRPRLFGRWFIRSSGPEGRTRIRARGPFVPPPTTPDAPERFLAQQDELRALLRDAAAVDLQRARVPSPLSRLLKLTLGESLHMLVVHQQRHLRQAQRVREEEAFPA